MQDSQPNAESRYRARFYFDPNSITMANNAAHFIFYGDSGTTAVLRVELRCTGATTSCPATGTYQLRVGLTNDTTTFSNSGWVNITDAPHVIEIDWQASTAPGANNGSLNWWIDETAQTGLSNIDNDTRRIDRARLGAVAGVDTTTNGTLYFDAFESRRSTYIGPMASPVVTTATSYVYDNLYRLKEANYSDSRYFHYTYDSVGNRLTEEKCVLLPCTLPITNTYSYDSANRLTSVNGQTYTWDNNGNLLNDGTSTYAYDAANRLTSVSNQSSVSSYQYNGLGDRLSQTVDSVTTNYALDLNAGLTQVLADGTNTYLYGNGRIGELQPGGWAYHLGDALGSVRQLTDGSAQVTLARSFEPYGNKLTEAGSGSTVYAFTGESFDANTGLTFLRARYFSSATGRFLTADSWNGSYIKLPTPTGGVGPETSRFVTEDWPGDYTRPLTLNRWNYVEASPVNRTDPSGMISEGAEAYYADQIVANLASTYSIHIIRDWGRLLIYPSPYSRDILCGAWREGVWQLQELSWINDAVHLTATTMGGPRKFKSAMQNRPVFITRWDTEVVRGWAPPGPLSTLLGDIVFTNFGFDHGERFVKYSVIHELGHVWDVRTGFRLSTYMAAAIGTYQCVTGDYGDQCLFNINAGREPPPGDPDDPYAGVAPWEDWAEAFATHVYPDYYLENRRNLPLGQLRRRYINEQINAIP